MSGDELIKGKKVIGKIKSGNENSHQMVTKMVTTIEKQVFSGNENGHHIKGRKALYINVLKVFYIKY
jgi:hypothetical protein